MDLSEYLEADVRPTTPDGAMVVLCAALGSPLSELSRVVACDALILRRAVEGDALSPEVLGATGRWVGCLWWRTLWRLGHASAHSLTEVDAVAMLSGSLPFVPLDWLADHGRAVVLGERREHIPYPRRLRGELNGRAKLTQRDVDAMRESSKRGATLRSLSARFGVSPSRVHRIVRGEAW